jgi:hypothetical protein
MTIAKSPMAPVVSTLYHVTSQGLVEEGEEMPAENNFWDESISTKVISEMKTSDQHTVMLSKQGFQYPKMADKGELPIVDYNLNPWH